MKTKLNEFYRKIEKTGNLAFLKAINKNWLKGIRARGKRPPVMEINGLRRNINGSAN